MPRTVAQCGDGDNSVVDAQHIAVPLWHASQLLCGQHAGPVGRVTAHEGGDGVEPGVGQAFLDGNEVPAMAGDGGWSGPIVVLRSRGRADTELDSTSAPTRMRLEAPRNLTAAVTSQPSQPASSQACHPPEAGKEMDQHKRGETNVRRMGHPRRDAQAGHNGARARPHCQNKQLQAA